MLTNPFWTALTTANADLSVGVGPARRYPADVIPFFALERPSTDALTALRDLSTPGEQLFCTGDSFPEVPGIIHDGTLPGLQMHFHGPIPAADDSSGILTLTEADMPEMLALKAVAFPGLFGPRANILGRFFGIRDTKGQLVAMAGERLSTRTHTEISAVCTHPDHTGRGHAARLVRHLLRDQAVRGTQSMLHTVTANTRAVSLYLRLGFTIAGEIGFHRFTRT